MAVVERSNTIIQKYVDYVSAPGASSAAAPSGDDIGFPVETEDTDPEDDAGDGGDNDDEPRDPIEALLEDIEDSGSTAGHIIQVFRLPNYARDGKLAGTQREYCGDLPASIDYLSMIREGYDDGAGSTYHCTLKNTRREIVRKWSITLAKQRNPYAAPATGATAVVPVQAAPIDPIAEVLKVAERYTKLRAAFFPDQAANLPAVAAAAPLAPGPEPASIEERILEKLLDRAEGDQLDRIVDRYVGGGRSESWAGIIADAIKPFVPTVLGLIARQQLGAAAPAVNPAQIPDGTAPEETNGEGEDDMEILDNILIPMLAETVKAGRISDSTLQVAASLIRDYQARHPIAAGFISVLRESRVDLVIGMLIGYEPQLAAVATKNPLVSQAIERLQAELRADGGSTAAPNGQTSET